MTSIEHSHATARSGIRSGGIVMLLIVAATVISLSMGLRQSLGLFLPPMNAELAVSASAFGFAIALQSLVWGVSQPFVGILGDRYGARPVLIGCALIYAVGLLLMASPHPVIGLNIGAGVLIGIGVAGTSFGVLLGTVSRSVAPEWRSQTIGLVSAGGSLGTLLLAPFGQAIISHHGWATALIVFAVIAFSIAIISLFIGREHHDGELAAASGPQSLLAALQSAGRHRGYVALTVAFFACGFQLLFIATHLAQYLAICGIPPSVS